MRARIKRRQRNRNILIITAVAVIVVVVVVAAYGLSNINQTTCPNCGSPVTSAVYQPLYKTANSASYGTTDASLLSSSYIHTVNGQPYKSGNKPIIVYIGGEFCPLCGFQRWPLVIALMRFGNFSNLEYMMSASDDTPANVPSFTFLHSTYTSQYIVFQSYEQEDRSQAQLQTVPQNYSNVFSQYGAGYPFLDFANQYIIEGSLFTPDNLVGLNWTQIVKTIGPNSNTQLSTQVMSSANAITTLICKVTGGIPSSVCGNSAITGLTTSLTAYYPALNTSLTTGTPSSMATPLASMRYDQALWNAEGSTKIK